MADNKQKKAEAAESEPDVQSTAPAPKFSKERLLASKKYTARRDLLSALLEDGKSYTGAEVDAMLETFLKGKVE